MFLIGGLGSKRNPSTGEINTVVASIILFFVSVKISHSTCAFLMGSEIGGTLMRKKSESVPALGMDIARQALSLTIAVLAWGIGWDIVAACVWTVVVPYLLGTPGANLGPKVGFIVRVAISAILTALLHPCPRIPRSMGS